MKNSYLKPANFRINTFITMIVLSTALLFSFKKSIPESALWIQLGLKQVQADESIKNSFLDGYLNTWSARNIKNIASGDRLSVAKDLLEYTKIYILSPAFKKEYQEKRAQFKPVQPAPSRTDDQVRNDYITSLKTALKNSEEAMQKMSAEYKPTFEESIQTFKAQIKEAESPASEMVGYMIMGEKALYDTKLKEYQEKMIAWEKDYPEDPIAMIKKRLQQFLDATKDVDFSAELTERYHKSCFVNPVYEQKSREWKMAFRAGKEVTAFARQFASGWLNELK